MDLIERLSDRAELMDLKARYFRYVDSQDWDAFPGLFAEDASFSAPDDFDGVQMAGREAIVENIRQALHDVVSIHHGFTPEFWFASDSVASGIWVMEDFLWAGEQSILPVSHIHGRGHYHEEYIRSATGWQFKSIELRRVRVDIQPR